MVRRKFILLVVALLLFLGGAIRLISISDHFTHVDDIGVAATIFALKEEHANKNIWRRNFKAAEQIPISWTYAPLQFCITAWLVNPEQSYRGVLFWGRFPSFVFGLLALLGMTYFLRKYFEDKYLLPLLVGLTVFSFSWESIIYAQQMESYTVGIFAVVVLLMLLWHFLQQNKIDLISAAVLGAIVSLLFYSQYQLLFFLPAFFATLLVSQWKKNPLKEIIYPFLISGSIVALTFIPLYSRYLSLHSGGGLNWNMGREKEFLFDISTVSGFEKIIYPVVFFARNFYLTLKTNFAFIPEDSAAYSIFLWVFLILVVTGIVRIGVSKNALKKYMGLFLLLFSVTWVGLCVIQKITFSPTRHSLVLQPLYVLLMGEGLVFLVKKMKLSKPEQFLAGTSTAALILVMFVYYYQDVTTSRKDPFDEKEMVQLLKEYQVTSIYPYTYTRNFRLMHDIYKGYFMDDGNNFTIRKDKGETICLLSTRRNYPYEYLNSNADFISDNVILPVDTSKADYKLVYKKEIFSTTEVDFNTRTENGTNEMFLYIFRKFR